MMFKLTFPLIILYVLAISRVNCGVVCSEDELVKEILEDLADNGKETY